MAPVLYGIGVGPGDPELLTIKAVNTIKNNRIIFAPKATAEHSSVAGRIISPYLSKEHTIIELIMPMSGDERILQKAWRENALLVSSYLTKNNSAAFVTLGDINLYSTFYYLLLELNSILPGVHVEIIPGITSFAAAAARTRWSLADKNNPLLILPVSKSTDLETSLKENNRVVLMKVGNYVNEIKTAIEKTGQWKGKIISYCGQTNEQVLDITSLDKITSLPYMTVILLAKE